MSFQLGHVKIIEPEDPIPLKPTGTLKSNIIQDFRHADRLRTLCTDGNWTGRQSTAFKTAFHLFTGPVLGKLASAFGLHLCRNRDRLELKTVRKMQRTANSLEVSE